MDKLLPHKKALEKHLKDRLGSMFGLKYDLLLYDVTSTYFEGQCQGNPMAQRGYSRDKRSDCKQICIGLVVSKCGMPLGYEVFEGNKNDVKTWQEIVTKMEAYYGKADRIWCGDRGFDSKTNREHMESNDIFNAVCPRNPALLAERLKEDEFRQAQNRRSQTEARISILSNCFCGSPMKQKGFNNRHVHMGLSILSHNLWVLARLKIAQEKARQKAA